MNDPMEKIRELVRKAGPFRILAVIVSGVLLLLLSYGGVFEKKDSGGNETVVTDVSRSAADDMETYRERMEKQVKAILERAEGVGAVDVMITLRASREKVTLKDNTVNVDKNEEESVIIEDENKNMSPYVIQETEPEIEGILVVCTGGDKASVQREIIAGISALFPVESHKIKVMKSKEAK